MSIKNNSIHYGDINLEQGELNLKEAKIRVTMMLDFDLVKAYKEIAKQRGGKYQTLINQKLREVLAYEKKEETLDSRVRKLEKRVFGGKRRKKAS